VVRRGAAGILGLCVPSPLKDEKRGQSGGSEPTPQRPPRRAQVGAGAPVGPMVPKTS